jgi:hypothetical protein
VAISGTRIAVGTVGTIPEQAIARSRPDIYDLPAHADVPVTTLNNPNPAANDLFGVSVAIFWRAKLVGQF